MRWSLVWIVALEFVLAGCIYWVGYLIGHSAGWKKGWDTAEALYSAPKEMVQVPYPGDLNVAKDLLGAIQRAAEGAAREKGK